MGTMKKISTMYDALRLEMIDYIAGMEEYIGRKINELYTYDMQEVTNKDNEMQAFIMKKIYEDSNEEDSHDDWINQLCNDFKEVKKLFEKELKNIEKQVFDILDNDIVESLGSFYIDKFIPRINEIINEIKKRQYNSKDILFLEMKKKKLWNDCKNMIFDIYIEKKTEYLAYYMSKIEEFNSTWKYIIEISVVDEKEENLEVQEGNNDTKKLNYKNREIREWKQLLNQLGYSKNRTTGGHEIYRKGEKIMVLKNHGSLGKGLQNTMLKQTGLK